MEKDQVTVALRASHLTGPLGQHVMSCFIGLDAGVQTLVVLDHDLGQDREVFRQGFPLGAWTSADADYVSAKVADVLYYYILRYKGIQPVLPVPAE